MCACMYAMLLVFVVKYYLCSSVYVVQVSKEPFMPNLSAFVARTMCQFVAFGPGSPGIQHDCVLAMATALEFKQQLNMAYIAYKCCSVSQLLLAALSLQIPHRR